ncbi:HNH endonuclease [Bosea sp. UC22_33]|uniref:HNH endonuclease n=1 Tax=Bosea sp. UC22_33 TaxID=3350165 RepID=UPI003672E98F
MNRRSLSTRDRLRIFTLHGGICHLCGGKVQAGEAWEVSHDTPLELGGADDDANRKPAHRKCHRAHTAAVDLPNIAKAKRREARHLGAKAPLSAPCPVLAPQAGNRSSLANG